MAIAFQGEVGSNSHEVCLAEFPDHTPMPCATFAATFAAVAEGQAALGLLPMENSVAGRVADVHRLLPNSGLRIVAERFKRVRFDLMTNAGVDPAGLTVVRSHPMALAQCEGVVARLGLRAEPALDTAGAARALAAEPDPRVCVLAPPLAAELYALSVPEVEVEDDPRNTTRFIALRRGMEQDGDADLPPGPAAITSIVFRLRDVPAALFKALGSFATNRVSLLKIESYGEGGGGFNIVSFYIEVAGAPADPDVALSLEELAFLTSEYQVIGVYPADPARSLPTPRHNHPARTASSGSVAEPVGEPHEDWGQTLDRLRGSIDNIDAAVVHLLAERFKATAKVGRLKADNDLPAADPARERAQLVRLRRLAGAAGLDPGFAEGFLQFVIARVVENHRRHREAGPARD